MAKKKKNDLNVVEMETGWQHKNGTIVYASGKSGL